MPAFVAPLASSLDAVPALHPLSLPLIDARGCLLSAPLAAEYDVPAFATVDHAGFAVRAADLDAGSVMLIVDEVPAGFRASEALVPGSCIAVTRGAPVPDGADTVVPNSAARRVTGGVMLDIAAPGTGVVTVGELLSVGAPLAAAGQVVDADLIGILSRAGVRAVDVHPRPRVAVVTVGTEFVEPGIATPVGLVSDYLSVLATAIAAEQGGLAFRIPPVLDDPVEINAVIDDHVHRSDLIVLCGVGTDDAASLATALNMHVDQSLSGDLLLHGMREHALVVGLPDDPVALRRLAREVLPLAIGRLMGRQNT